MTNKTIEIYNPEDDGFQIVFIDGEFYAALHFNDEQFGFEVESLIEKLGFNLVKGCHSDIPEKYWDVIQSLDIELDVDDE